MGDICYIETIVPSLGNIKIKFYGNDIELYKIYVELNEFERQKKSKHLGIISKIHDGANHTRFDYLATQCAMVDILDNLNKGIQNVQLGEISISGRKVKGNSLLKSWFLFSNLGHCYNTIADEKAMLLYSLENKEMRKELINTIKDNDIKKWAKQVIERFDYMKFHYVIAFYRIYKHRHNLHNTNKIIEPLKLLILDDIDEGVTNKCKLDQLKHIHRTLRDLSMISLDCQYSHIPFSVNIFASLASLSSWENYYTEQHFIKHLSPFVNLLSKEIYLNERILANQKDYETKAIDFISSNSKCYEEIISIAINQGLGTGCKNIDCFKHFARLPLFNKSKNIKEYVIEIEDYIKDISNTYFVIDKNGNNFFVDFIYDKSITKSEFARFYYKICRLISMQADVLVNSSISSFAKIYEMEEVQQINEDIKNLIKKVIRTKAEKEANQILAEIYKELLWGTIRFFIKQKYTFDISPTSDKYNSFGMEFNGFDSLTENIALALMFFASTFCNEMQCKSVTPQVVFNCQFVSSMSGSIASYHDQIQ